MKPLASGLILSGEHWSQLQEDVSSRPLEEACGFLAGTGNQVRCVIPVMNVLHDPHRFRMDAREELTALQQIENEDLELMAIYHSHPHGIRRPSPTDIAELTFPGIIYLILFQDGPHWDCRGYLMQPTGEAGEVPVTVLREP